MLSFMMGIERIDLLVAGILGFATLLLYIVHQFRAHRRLMHGLPQPPHHPVWGHLHLFGELREKYPSDIHPQWYPTVLKKQYNLGDIFYLDAWPAGTKMMVLCSGETAGQAINAHKHQMLVDFLPPLTGDHSLIAMEGKEWKRWRSIFNPGFSASHLLTLIPTIVDDTSTFVEILKEHAERQDIFRLEEVATRLTVDIIGRVTLDVSFNVQRSTNEFVTAFRSSVAWLFDDNVINPFKRYNVLRPIRHFLNMRTMDKYLGRILDERIARNRSMNVQGNTKRNRSIVSLALETYNNEFRDKTTSKGKMDPEFRRYAIDQLKTFIFAGHDTTSSTICYIFYLLSQNPDVLNEVCKEYDIVFGKDVSTAADTIRRDPYILNRLEYSAAIIKETLRIFPVASSVRKGDPGLHIFDPKTGQSYPTEGSMIWMLTPAIQHNTDFWSDPEAFRPERFLGTNTASLPKDAWRPFEKGPRSCIGQELAYLEIKMAMVLCLRTFRITTAYDQVDQLSGDGLGWGRDVGKGKLGTMGEEAYQILRATAKPRQGMPVRVSFRT